MYRLVVGLLLATSLAHPAMSQDSPAGSYADFVPGGSGEYFSTAGETPPDTGLVIRLFELGFAEACSWSLGGSLDMREPEVFDLTYRYEFDEPDQPDRPLKLYRFFCGAGAYNQQHVYMAWDGDSGLRPLSFARPTFAATYVDPGNSDSAVASLAVTGAEGTQVLVNSSFDPETRRITSWSCWRGLCDASAHGTWVADGPGFRLETFSVDPSYDGEVNLVRLADHTAPVEVPLTFIEAPEWPNPEGEEEETTE